MTFLVTNWRKRQQRTLIKKLEKISPSDLFNFPKKNLQRSWNNVWKSSVEIDEKFVNKDLVTRNFDHRLQVVLNGLKIGHTRLTHAYPIWISNQPIWNICNCQITLNTIRNNYRIKKILSENHCDKNQVLRCFLVFERHRYLTKFN